MKQTKKAGKATAPTIFDTLAIALAEHGGSPEGRRPVDIELLEFEEYLERFVELAQDLIICHEEHTMEEWREFLGFDSRLDLSKVALPRIAAALTQFAVNGEIGQAWLAFYEMVYFLIREQIRRGSLPVYMPTRDLPTISMSEIEDQLHEELYGDRHQTLQ